VLPWLLAALAIGATRAETPGPAAPGPHTITVGGQPRAYRLYEPRTLDRARPAPLVLVFHGGGGTPEQIERSAGFNALADREGFVVVYPAGYRKSWNDGRGAEAVAAQREQLDDVAFIDALLDEVFARHRIDPRRVYATGISNGAMFSHHVALRLAPRIAAIAPVAGGLPEPLTGGFSAPPGVSVLVINGTDDPLVPYAGGDVTVFGSRRGRVIGAEDTAAKWRTANRCAEAPAAEEVTADPAGGCAATRFTWSGCAPGTSVQLLRINGGGHTWPGGRQFLPQRIVGKACRAPDGATLIWEFFKRHPKP
jgi:polyhydroxybutyrate depolymerase